MNNIEEYFGFLFGCAFAKQHAKGFQLLLVENCLTLGCSMRQLVRYLLYGHLAWYLVWNLARLHGKLRVCLVHGRVLCRLSFLRHRLLIHDSFVAALPNQKLYHLTFVVLKLVPSREVLKSILHVLQLHEINGPLGMGLDDVLGLAVGGDGLVHVKYEPITVHAVKGKLHLKLREAI